LFWPEGYRGWWETGKGKKGKKGGPDGHFVQALIQGKEFTSMWRLGALQGSWTKGGGRGGKKMTSLSSVGKRGRNTSTAAAAARQEKRSDHKKGGRERGGAAGPPLFFFKKGNARRVSIYTHLVEKEEGEKGGRIETIFDPQFLE